LISIGKKSTDIFRNLAAKGLPPIAGMEVMAVEKVDQALERLL